MVTLLFFFFLFFFSPLFLQSFRFHFALEVSIAPNFRLGNRPCDGLKSGQGLVYGNIQ